MTLRKRLEEKRKQEPLECKAWGEGLFIRRLSVRDRILCEKLSADTPKLFSHVMIASLVNENGEPQLTEADEPLVQDQDAEVVMQVVEQVMRFNAMTKDTHEANLKNSENDQPSLSPVA